MEIKYEKDEDGLFGITQCPYKCGTVGAVYYVGSIGCEICKNFRGKNRESQTVTCSHPEGEK